MNGPNLGRLGHRRPEIYGIQTLSELVGRVRTHAESRRATLVDFQSNHEGALIDRLEELDFDAVVVNPGALGHTSYALRDAIEGIALRVVEVHITDVRNRETFRQVLVLEDVVQAQIIGRGVDGYIEAVDFLIDSRQ